MINQDDAAPRATDPAWHAARRLVLRHGWPAVGYQTLNPGLRLWLSQSGDAVAGYARVGRTRVVAGAPVCAAERLEAVLDELAVDAHDHGERLLFVGAETRLARVCEARWDHRSVLLGAQPVWDPAGWPALVRRKASLRAQLLRARNKSVEVREWPAERARNDAALRAVLRQWLAGRGLPPLHFMATPDLLAWLHDRRVFVAEHGPTREIVGFLVAAPVPARGGWLIEQWPRVPAAPNGTTHLLVDAAMRALATDGARYVTLGLAPLSERAGDVACGQPAWLRWSLRWLRAHGRRFYNFTGLEAFKASLCPTRWDPVYAIVQSRQVTPAMLRAVVAAFSGGSPEPWLARALASAMGRELRTAGRGALGLAVGRERE